MKTSFLQVLLPAVITALSLTTAPAIPPLSRSNAGISPADYFGRTRVAKDQGGARA